MDTFVILLLATSLLCIDARPSEEAGMEGDNSTLVYPWDLPPPLDWTAQDFNDLEGALERLKVCLCTHF